MIVIKLITGAYQLSPTNQTDEAFIEAMAKCTAPIVVNDEETEPGTLEMAASEDNYWAVGRAVVQASIAAALADKLAAQAIAQHKANSPREL